MSIDTKTKNYWIDPETSTRYKPLSADETRRAWDLYFLAAFEIEGNDEKAAAIMADRMLIERIKRFAIALDAGE